VLGAPNASIASSGWPASSSLDRAVEITSKYTSRQVHPGHHGRSVYGLPGRSINRSLMKINIESEKPDKQIRGPLKRIAKIDPKVRHQNRKKLYEENSNNKRYKIIRGENAAHLSMPSGPPAFHQMRPGEGAPNQAWASSRLPPRMPNGPIPSRAESHATLSLLQA